MTEPLIEAQGIRLGFGAGDVLSGVDLRVEVGQVVTLIGPNGAGKSTLVRVALGLLTPDGGTVKRRAGLRIGYMPQKLHIDETLPLTVRRFLELGTRDERRAIPEVLEEVKATAILDKPMQSISGGETQRVLLARALLREPDLLVLDEPVQGVDVNGQAELYRLIARIRDRHGCGVLMVSHDLHLVMAQTDRVICLNGHVCCAGHPETVSRDPAYVALFGRQAAETIAVYHHHHTHRHGLDGSVEGGGHDHG